MKLEVWLAAAVLASSAAAAGPANPLTPPRLKGKPEKMAGWRWPNPFASPDYLKKFSAACSAEGTFGATEYVLDDLALEPPLGLLQFRDALKDVFGAREYPGSWDGVDPHGYDRVLLMMDYDDVPLRVREWIEEQARRGDGAAGKGLFAVYARPAPGTRAADTVPVPDQAPVSEEWRAKDERRVVIFAPGAVHEVLPLWVAEGSDCEETLLDISKYSAKLADGGVVAYPVAHTRPNRGQDRRDMEFTIRAQVLKLKSGEDAAEEAGDTVTEEAKRSEEPPKAEEAAKPAESTKPEEASAEKDEL